MMRMRATTPKTRPIVVSEVDSSEVVEEGEVSLSESGIMSNKSSWWLMCGGVGLHRLVRTR